MVQQRKIIETTDRLPTFHSFANTTTPSSIAVEGRVVALRQDRRAESVFEQELVHDQYADARVAVPIGMQVFEPTVQLRNFQQFRRFDIVLRGH